MPAPLVVPLTEKHVIEVREIFFESSTRKTFKDDGEREDFYQKYLGFYLTHFPEFAKVAILDKKVLGYVVVAPKTEGVELVLLQPHLVLFKDYFEKYPAHLHINCHHLSRGLGVGTLLIESIVQELKGRDIRGLHIMTSAGSKNVNFYRKLGFTFETEEEFHGSAILFMGKSIGTISL
jgi:GNAT superfamily N-acetyltransferase